MVFATSAPETGLQQVAAGGGPVTVRTRPDQGKGEADHVWPEALPGGGAVLLTIMATTGNAQASQIAVLDHSGVFALASCTLTPAGYPRPSTHDRRSGVETTDTLTVSSAGDWFGGT